MGFFSRYSSHEGWSSIRRSTNAAALVIWWSCILGTHPEESMFAINPYLWISLELWVFLWSTTCTDHLGLSKNIVRVGKQHNSCRFLYFFLFVRFSDGFSDVLRCKPAAAQPGSKYGFGRRRRRLIAACAAMPGERVRRYNAWNCAELSWLQDLVDLNSEHLWLTSYQL